MLRTIISVFITLLLISFGCTRTPARYAAALTDADSLAECGRADSARTLLSTIPADSLSRADKALLYLLWVKTSDKAFLTHTSADTIRIALDYFGSHGPKLRRAEARYYEARVLTDLKDYAPALDAFDEALALLGDDTTRAATLRLRSRILSQNAQLFEDLRLYSEAIPFYKAAADVSMALNDSTDAFLDIDQTVFDLIQLDSIEAAEASLADALYLRPALTPSHQAKLEITKRYIHLKKGEYAKAAAGIDTVLASRPPRFRNLGLMVAIDAYQGLGLRDSADSFANILINQEFGSNKNAAYLTLLRNRLFNSNNLTTLRLVNTLDSLNDIDINTYRKAPEIVGTEFLKYRMEQKESMRLLRHKHSLILVIVVVSLMLLVFIALLFALKARNTARRIKYERKEQELTYRRLLLEQANFTLREKNGLLSDSNKILSKKNAQLVENNTLLYEQNQSLMQEHTSLTERHTLLTEQYEHLDQLNHRLSEINADLESHTVCPVYPADAAAVPSAALPDGAYTLRLVTAESAYLGPLTIE